MAEDRGCEIVLADATERRMFIAPRAIRVIEEVEFYAIGLVGGPPCSCSPECRRVYGLREDAERLGDDMSLWPEPSRSDESATCPATEAADPCVLEDGHEGPHSWFVPSYHPMLGPTLRDAPRGVTAVTDEFLEDILSQVEDTRSLARAKHALHMIGYSKHSGSPRFGTKAQVARWGLGHTEDLPEGYEPAKVGE